MMMKRLLFVLYVVAVCLCLFLPAQCDAKRKKRRHKSRAGVSVSEKDGISTRNDLNLRDKVLGFPPGDRQQTRSLGLTDRQTLCGTEGCTEEEQVKDKTRRERKRKNRGRRRRKLRARYDVKKTKRKGNKEGDKKSTKKSRSRHRTDGENVSIDRRESRERADKPDIVVEQPVEDIRSISRDRKNDDSESTEGNVRGSKKIGRRKNRLNSNALQKARMDLRRRQGSRKAKLRKDEKDLNTPEPPTRETTTKSTVAPVRKNDAVEFEFEFPPFPYDKPAADMPESDLKILKFLAIQTARLDLRSRFGSRSRKAEVSKPVEKKVKIVSHVEMETEPESDTEPEEIVEATTTTTTATPTTRKRFRLADLWKARQDLRRRYGNKGGNTSDYPKEPSAQPPEKAAADMAPEMTLKLKKVAGLNKARQNLRQRHGSVEEADETETDSAVSDDTIKTSDATKGTEKRKDKKKKDRRGKSKTAGTGIKIRKHRKSRWNRLSDRWRKTMKGGKWRKSKRKLHKRRKHGKRRKGQADLGSDPMQKDDGEESQSETESVEIKDIYDQALSDMPSEERTEKLKKLAIVHRARQNLRSRLGSSDKSKRRKKRKRVKSRKLKRKHRKRKRKGRKGKKRRGRKFLEKAERRFRRKNARIERKLSKLNQNTLHDLSVLKSVRFDQHDDLFPTKPSSLMSLENEVLIQPSLEEPISKEQTSLEMKPSETQNRRRRDSDRGNPDNAAPETDDKPSRNLMAANSASEWYKVFNPFSNSMTKVEKIHSDQEENDDRNMMNDTPSEEKSKDAKINKTRRHKLKQRQRQRRLGRERKRRRHQRKIRTQNERTELVESAEDTGESDSPVHKNGQVKGSKPSTRVRMSTLRRKSKHYRALRRKIQRQKIDHYKRRLRKQSSRNRKLRQQISEHQKTHTSGDKKERISSRQRKRLSSKQRKRLSNRQRKRVSSNSKKKKLSSAQKKDQVSSQGKKSSSSTEWKSQSVEQKQPAPSFEDEEGGGLSNQHRESSSSLHMETRMPPRKEMGQTTMGHSIHSSSQLTKSRIPDQDTDKGHSIHSSSQLTKSRIPDQDADDLSGPQKETMFGQRADSLTTPREDDQGVEQSDQTGSRRVGAFRPEPGRRRGYYAPRENLKLPDRTTGGNRWRPDPKSRHSMMSAAAPYDRMQRVSPVLNRSYRQLMVHLNGVLQGIYGQMQMTEELYKKVFNGTRYDLILGARDIFEKVAVANTYIYGGVVRASEFTRNIYTRAHHNKKARRMNRPQDEPKIPTDIQVTRRNFRPILQKAYGERERIKNELQKTQQMKMKCMQGHSRLEQVREELIDDYDHVAIRDLFYNINSTIYRVNGGIVTSRGLNQLQREKFYITFVDDDVKVASAILRNSSVEMNTCLREYRDNYNMYTKWRNNGHEKNIQRDERSFYSSQDWIRLETLVSKAKRQAYRLKIDSEDLISWLNDAIENARIALQARGQSLPSEEQVTFDVSYLENETQQLEAALEDLKEMAGSKTKKNGGKVSPGKDSGTNVKKEKECKKSDSYWWFAGSNDDEDCITDGSGDDGDTGSGEDIVFITDDEDFTFEEGSSEQSPMQQFGVALREYASTVLSDSMVLDNKANEVEEQLKKLQKKREESLAGISKVFEVFHEQQGLILQEADLHAMKEEVAYRTKKVFERLKAIDEYDLEAVTARARKALEHAKKDSKEDISKPSVTRQPDTDEEEDNTDDDDDDEDDDDFDYSSLFRKGREIMSNSNDIVYLRSVAMESCGKFKRQSDDIRSNISVLQQKVASARQILSSLQLSIKKTGSNHISLDVNSDDRRKAQASSVSTFGVCIKPATLDGTVLAVKGNNYASYSVSLDDGELTVTAYDSDLSKLDDITMDSQLEQDQWYTLWVQRNGQTMDVKLQKQDGEQEVKSQYLSDLRLSSVQTWPQMVFVGGAPEDSEFDSNSWEGCVGRLTVNGQSIPLFKPDSEGLPTALCDSHCTSPAGQSFVFDGNGFIHHSRPPRETVDKIAFTFKTHQKKAVLISLANRRRRFFVSVVLEEGALKVESSSPREEVVLLSRNGSLNDGQSHHLEILYRGSKTYPELDGEKGAFFVESSNPQVFRTVMEGVILGALVSQTRQFINSPYRPLIGCISEVFVNGHKLLGADATEMYEAYEGTCASSSAWHSCRKFTDESSTVSLGSVENSNRISFLVGADARGPVLLYTKEDKFELEITLTDDGISVATEDKESVIVKPLEYEKYFSMITVEDTGSAIKVKAWEEGASISYGGGWGFFANTDSPHDIALSQTTDGAERKFTGAIAHLLIEDRIYNLGQHDTTNMLMACQRPLEDIQPTSDARSSPAVDGISCM